jgi:hypothetical protein
LIEATSERRDHNRTEANAEPDAQVIETPVFTEETLTLRFTAAA